MYIDTSLPRQNDRHFADDMFKRIFSNENVKISIQISPKVIPWGSIPNKLTLVQAMAWRRTGAKPLSEPIVTYSSLTHICGTRGRCVNGPCCIFFHHGTPKLGLKRMVFFFFLFTQIRCMWKYGSIIIKLSNFTVSPYPLIILLPHSPWNIWIIDPFNTTPFFSISYESTKNISPN